MKKLLVAVGTLISFNGFCLCIFTNLNLGTILTVAIGVLFILSGTYYDKINRLTQKGIFKYLEIFVLVILVVEMILSGFLMLYGQCDNVTYNEDAVVVLGAGIRGDRVTLTLKLRLDKAAEYHKKNPDALIVVTGGQGAQETVTEAYAMEKYLISQGVDQNVIIKEERATSTEENMTYSKEILDSLLDDGYKTVVITNNFHIYRAVAYAKEKGFENITHMHAPLQWYNIFPCYLREIMAVLKMWVW